MPTDVIFGIDRPSVDVVLIECSVFTVAFLSDNYIVVGEVLDTIKDTVILSSTRTPWEMWCSRIFYVNHGSNPCPLKDRTLGRARYNHLDNHV